MLNTFQIEANKTEFCKRLRATNRPGVEELIAWMETTDFFTAPASSQFHEAYAGGLVQHSLRVNDTIHKAYPIVCKDNAKSYSDATLDIISLLHDLCKTNFYQPDVRNVKNPTTGMWEKVPCYKIVDQFPMGHGEKSVWLIERFVRLTAEEALAIRWHMGAYDSAVKGGERAFNPARTYSPLVDLLHLADNFTSLALGSAE